MKLDIYNFLSTNQFIYIYETNNCSHLTVTPNPNFCG